MSVVVPTTSYCPGGGADGSPIHPDAWKRAVYRPPPTHFSVEMLPPVRQSGDYNFGMRICPIREDGRSQSSRGSNSEYDIWRRWEDCLWFQDCLETEYERKSRAKIKRLQAGKGVRKHGVYIRKDAASSWDSLPPGPDPSSVAVDIHQYVPKLTKKGTLFRASQATTEQRHRELQACINGLFADDVPTLIQELRESRDVTDFFGYWRLDFDLAVKKQKKTPESAPRASLSSSVFSTYFSGGSNTNISDPDATLVNPASPSKKLKSKSSFALSHATPRRSPHGPPSSMSSRLTGKSSYYSESEDETYSRRGSDASETSSRGPPSPCSTNGSSPYIVQHDPQISFGHNPDQPLYGVASGLESLPEDQELVAPMSGMKPSRESEPRSRERRISNRQGQVYSFPSEQEDLSPEEQYSNRMSWMTTTSVAETINPASYLAELGMDLSLPKSPSTSAFPRSSMLSFASFMTDSSADAIVPSPNGDTRRSLSADSLRTTRPISGIEADNWPDNDGDILDAYFDDTFGRPSSAVLESRSETPVANHPTSLSFRASMFSTRSRSSTISSTPSSSSSSATSTASSTSPTSSLFSATTSTFSETSTISPDGHISVKVSHDRAIILLRVHRTISFTDLRTKIYDKYVSQEGVPLSRSFALGYVPASNADVPGPRTRSASMSSAEMPKGAQMRFIHTQSEWEYAVATLGRGKLILRAIGEEAS